MSRPALPPRWPVASNAQPATWVASAHAEAAPPAAEWRRYRVVKTLAPKDRGALLFARQYGDALVCVRHRADAKGKVRHTTVELLVHSTPIQPRNTQHVLIRLRRNEQALIAMVQAAGGTWEATEKLWKLPSRVVTILKLRGRIVAR